MGTINDPLVSSYKYMYITTFVLILLIKKLYGGKTNWHTFSPYMQDDVIMLKKNNYVFKGDTLLFEIIFIIFVGYSVW